MALKLIAHYFPDWPATTLAQLEGLQQILLSWNEKINLISRKDTEAFEERHLLHCLSILKWFDFPAGAEILDVGSGGGLPVLPLAIVRSDIQFTAVDSVRKKMWAVEAMRDALGLENLQVEHARMEKLNWKGDYVLARAVAPMPRLVGWTKDKIKSQPWVHPDTPPRGWIALKGGDLTEELYAFRNRVEVIKLSNLLETKFFETKKIIYLPKMVKQEV